MFGKLIITENSFHMDKEISFFLAQLTGTVEYTDCISAKENDRYNTKPSDCEAPH